MNVLNLQKLIVNTVLRPFPLIAEKKIPFAKDYLREQIEFRENNNIGLYMGSNNGQIVADLDDEKSRSSVSIKFVDMGLWDQLVVHTPKKGGLHVWLRCKNVPEELIAQILTLD